MFVDLENRNKNFHLQDWNFQRETVTEAVSCRVRSVAPKCLASNIRQRGSEKSWKERFTSNQSRIWKCCKYWIHQSQEQPVPLINPHFLLFEAQKSSRCVVMYRLQACAYASTGIIEVKILVIWEIPSHFLTRYESISDSGHALVTSLRIYDFHYFIGLICILLSTFTSVLFILNSYNILFTNGNILHLIWHCCRMYSSETKLTVLWSLSNAN